MNSARGLELAGYSPCRADFDVVSFELIPGIASKDKV